MLSVVPALRIDQTWFISTIPIEQDTPGRCLPSLANRLASCCNWFQNGSMNITLKNVPDSVYRVIKREAKKKRRSLNAEIIQALESEAAEAERRRQLGNLRKELDRFAASLPPLEDSAPLIRADRER
jgi:hypothetical protein